MPATCIRHLPFRELELDPHRVFVCCLHDPLIPLTDITRSALYVPRSLAHGTTPNFFRIASAACPLSQNSVPRVLACTDFPSFDQHIVHHPSAFCRRHIELGDAHPFEARQTLSLSNFDYSSTTMTIRDFPPLRHAPDFSQHQAGSPYSSAIPASAYFNADSGYVPARCSHSAPQSYHSPRPSASRHPPRALSTTHRRVYDLLYLNLCRVSSYDDSRVSPSFCSPSPLPVQLCRKTHGGKDTL